MNKVRLCVNPFVVFEKSDFKDYVFLQVLPGLFVGNYRDSKDLNQLQTHNITHILAIHDSPKHLYPQIHYLCVKANDHPDQNLSQYFSVCNDFIHAARLRKDCNVLVHCLAGMSRSVTITVVYIMCISDLNWQDALRYIIKLLIYTIEILYCKITFIFLSGLLELEEKQQIQIQVF